MTFVKWGWSNWLVYDFIFKYKVLIFQKINFIIFQKLAIELINVIQILKACFNAKKSV